jgi:hypothetical protein
MRAIKTRYFFPISVLLIILCTCNAFGAVKKSIDDLLPGGYIKQDVYKSGIGAPVGTVIIARGEAVIIHAGANIGYPASSGVSLYKGDILVTRTGGRLQLRLKDQSVLTILPDSHLELNEGVYDEAKKSRFSFLKINLGKILFKVKKYVKMNRSEFEVETTTMVCGLRGSEFVIAVEGSSSEVTTFENTKLAILSTAFPDAPPTVLEDYKKVTVEEGKMPGTPELVSKEEANILKQEFVIPGMSETESTAEGESRGGMTGAEPEQVQTGGNIEVLVSETELVNPEEILMGGIEGLTQTEILDEIQRFDEIENIQNDQFQMQEIFNQPVQDLPGFPVMPE